MNRKIKGFVRLVRCSEFFCFVIITTLLGVDAAQGECGWRMAGVLAANWLAVAFAFMINDVADAPDDALTPHKYQRNPVSCADLTPRSATIASGIVAAVAVLVYLLLGLWPLVIGLITLLFGFLYSWRPIRFKDKPFVDLACHGLMLAGCQFLAGYFTFQPRPSDVWIYPFIFIVAISLYGELFNELRDLEGDRKAGLNHTANFLGPRLAFGLMMGLLTIGVGAALATVLVAHLIPGWVLLLLGALAALFVIPAGIKARSRRSHIELQQSFQKPLEIAAAMALVVQIVGTWVWEYIPWHWF